MNLRLGDILKTGGYRTKYLVEGFGMCKFLLLFITLK